jgi:hypothetical protein
MPVLTGTKTASVTFQNSKEGVIIFAVRKAGRK